MKIRKRIQLILTTFESHNISVSSIEVKKRKCIIKTCNSRTFLDKMNNRLDTEHALGKIRCKDINITSEQPQYAALIYNTIECTLIK